MAKIIIYIANLEDVVKLMKKRYIVDIYFINKQIYNMAVKNGFEPKAWKEKNVGMKICYFTKYPDNEAKEIL